MAVLTQKNVNLNSVYNIEIVSQAFNLYPHLNAEKMYHLLRKVLGFNASLATSTALEALSQVGLAEKASSYPSELSGGQQRV